MMMKYAVISLNIALVTMLPLIIQAQEHVHGAGLVFVVQEGNNWQVQYVLPASDALGFEHAPENQQQRNSLTSLGNTLVKVEHLMDFNRACTQIAYSHNLSEFNSAFENDDHNQTDHHQDIHVSYTLKCSSGITGVSFKVFEKMYSLQKLEVQWSIDLGQGSAMLSKNMTELEFNK